MMIGTQNVKVLPIANFLGQSIFFYLSPYNDPVSSYRKFSLCSSKNINSLFKNIFRFQRLLNSEEVYLKEVLGVPPGGQI